MFAEYFGVNYLVINILDVVKSFQRAWDLSRDGRRCDPTVAVAGNGGLKQGLWLRSKGLEFSDTAESLGVRRSSHTMEDKHSIQIIEWEQLDKKFYVIGVAMTMMIRVSMYPFILSHTHVQVQRGKSLYHETFDAFVKIL